MTTQRDVAVFVGSLRKESFSRRIAHALATVAPPVLALDIVEIGQLGFYDQDLETAEPPAPWRAAETTESVAAAQGPLHFAKRAMRDLRAAGVDTYRVPDAALEDFVESHAPPPERHRPSRGRRFTSAWGPNKKMAEQKAALLALEELGVFDPKDVDEAIEQISEAPDA